MLLNKLVLLALVQEVLVQAELPHREYGVLRVQILLVRLQRIVLEDLRKLMRLRVKRVREGAVLLRLEKREYVSLDQLVLSYLVLLVLNLFCFCVSFAVHPFKNLP